MFKRFFKNVFEEEFIKRVLTPILIVVILSGSLYVFYSPFVCYVITIGFATLYFYTKYAYNFDYEEVYEQTNELPKVEVNKQEIEEEIEPEAPSYENRIMTNPYENVNSSLTGEEREAFDEVFGVNEEQREYAPIYNQYDEFDERAFENNNVEQSYQVPPNQPIRQQAPVRQNVQRQPQNVNQGGQPHQVNREQAPRQRVQQPQSQMQRQPQQSSQRAANQNVRPVRQRPMQQGQANNPQRVQQQAPSNRQQNIQNQNRQARRASAKPIRQQQPANRVQRRPVNQEPQRAPKKKQFNYDEDFEFEYYPYDD